ncbi:hypothetical protein [Cryptosporangium phraense]|uniref:Uncharacterized protein n=1 Tax=Cryptosporangium phraense TaxID=2593070 RepID=A0A545AQK8_9ACTN|nr:hypothetical protein [Cryptosporangium phraense]TQS43604.1 hypothetical protein FL583_18385 [Cryptosporangium phraense]
MTTRTLPLLCALLVLLVGAGCSGKDSPGEKESTVPVRSPEVVQNAVAALAETLPAALGSTGPLSGNAPRVTPCADTESGPFYVQGAYQVVLPEERHRPALTRLRDRWIAAGWTKVAYRPFGAAGTRAELSGISPDEHFDVRITSGTPPRGFAVIVISPCFSAG